MDLVVINPDTWYPEGAPIKHYSSLIWTERYSSVGEFQLKTFAVSKTLEELPLGSLVSIRGSTEIMMVLKHNIDTDSKGVEALTVTGKSLTFLCDYRVIGEIRGIKYRSFNHSALMSAAKLLYNAFVNATNYDMTLDPPATRYYKSIRDVIPDTTVTLSTNEIETGSQGPLIRRYFEPGNMGNPLRELLSYRPYGLRIVKPPHTAYVVTVATDGAATRTLTQDIQTMSFDIYAGKDRSHTQTSEKAVIFDVEIDDLMLPNYMFSLEDYRTEAWIGLNNKAIFAYTKDDPNASTLSGIERRLIYIDGGDPEEGYTPEEWDSHSTENAESILETHKKTSLIDGGVSAQSKLKYLRDYFLGDIVSVRGRYGPVSRARVTEFIRTDDERGEEGYPSLVYI